MGLVDADDLATVLAGCDPSTGESLGSRRGRKVPGFDLTFRALRTGETVALNRDDVDLPAAVLAVRDGKWHKTRQVPVHATVTAALDDYRQTRDATLPDASADAFFGSTSGARLTVAELTRRFRRMLDDLGTSAPAFRRPPRLYELRHSFAVATLVDWHAAGVDVHARLPVLSTYLGHLNPASTYWYLQAAPELLGVVAQRVQRATGAGT